MIPTIDSAYSLNLEIKSKGTRGGTYITNEWLNKLEVIINNNPFFVNKETFESADYLMICQEKADSYDWSEYMEQVPKIDYLKSILQHAITKT